MEVLAKRLFFLEKAIICHPKVAQGSEVLARVIFVKEAILDSGFWTLNSGLWALDSGLDSGPWTLDSGL